MFYKALGFVVWKLGRRYLRSRMGAIPAPVRRAPRRLGVAALVGAGIAVAALMRGRAKGAAA